MIANKPVCVTLARPCLRSVQPAIPFSLKLLFDCGEAFIPILKGNNLVVSVCRSESRNRNRQIFGLDAYSDNLSMQLLGIADSGTYRREYPLFQ